MKDKQLIKAFEKWYKKRIIYIEYWEFLHLPESMQWGVLQEFYDSEGVYIFISRVIMDDGLHYWFQIYNNCTYDERKTFKTRTEVISTALIKAEEIWIKNNGKG